MPKKSASARSGAQRNKPKMQKSIQLVRQNVEETEPVFEQDADSTSKVEESLASEEQTPASVSTAVALETASETTTKESIPNPTSTAIRKKASLQLATPEPQDEEASSISSKGSAASRLAARRQAVQKAQQRAAATLITAEHYSYVRRDLIVIAILAFIMFAVIIGLHFVPAIGG